MKYVTEPGNGSRNDVMCLFSNLEKRCGHTGLPLPFHTEQKKWIWILSGSNIFILWVDEPNRVYSLKVHYSSYQCDYAAKDISQLIQHVHFIHEGMCYTCYQCDYKAKYKTHLIQHLKLDHDAIHCLWYQCDYKDKEILQLIQHVNFIHEGVP